MQSIETPKKYIIHPWMSRMSDLDLQLHVEFPVKTTEIQLRLACNHSVAGCYSTTAPVNKRVAGGVRAKPTHSPFSIFKPVERFQFKLKAAFINLLCSCTPVNKVVCCSVLTLT